MKLEDKYCILNNLNKISKSIDNFRLDWNFSTHIDFEKIIEDFIKEHGTINKDVFYVLESTVNLEALEDLKDKETIEFSNGTVLEKIGNEKTHTYLYHNYKPLAFGLHIHTEHKEIVEPILNDIIVYIIVKNKLKKINVKVGEKYITPRGVKHAALFSRNNTIKLTWVNN